MNFNEQSKIPEKNEQESPLQEIVRLYKELIESGKIFRFPGFDPERYKKMKEGDNEDIYGYMTPTDTLSDRFLVHGVRFPDVKYPKSGNILIIPNDSTDIVKDGIRIENLNSTTIEDQKFRRLTVLCQETEK